MLFVSIALFVLLFSFFVSSYADPRDLHSFPHDALPIFVELRRRRVDVTARRDDEGHVALAQPCRDRPDVLARSEEHTSELQSRPHLVCRLLLEKKKKKHRKTHPNFTTMP